MRSIKSRGVSRAAFLILFVILTGKGQAQVSTLATPFGGTHLGYQGYYLDIRATKNLIVRSFDVETDSMATFPSDPSISAEVWVVKDGGAVDGHQDRPEDWRLAGFSGPLATTPLGSFRPLNLQLDEFLASGEILGFYIVRHRMKTHLRGFNNITPGTVLATNADLTLRCAEGSNSIYFFGDATGFGSGPSIQVHYELHPSNPVDIRMTRLVSPVQEQGCKIYGFETIKVELQNVGKNALPAGSILSWSVSIDSGPAQTSFELLLQPLPVSARRSYAFPTTFDLSAIGSHQITVSVQTTGDGFPGNDAISEMIVSGGEARISSFPYEEDFESVPIGARMAFPPGWEQDWSDGNGLASEWLLTRDKGSFCAFSDHTTAVPDLGAYAYCEDESTNYKINLRSPCIDLTSGINLPRLSFWWARSNNPGANVSTISVDVIEYPSGTLHLDVGGPYASLVSGWHYATADLSPFLGKEIQIQFSMLNHALSQTVDIGLDDVRIIDVQPTPGQNEQPGLASFRIGEALNINGDPQVELSGGPYYISLDAGDPLVFEFEGQSNQPIIFLAGYLNPQSATFLNAGSLDIGSQPDPVTGIPSGILVLADGTSLFGLLSPFMITNSAGSCFLSFTMPVGFPGPISTFQAAILTDGSNATWFALSNAIQLSSN